MNVLKTSLLALPLIFVTLACSDQEPNKSQQPATAVHTAQKAAEQSSKSNGQLIYEANCGGCHDTGVAGAPKLGDTEIWQRHAGHGAQHLMEAVLTGKGSMPPRGGNADLSNKDIEAAINFILEKSLKKH